MNDEQINEVMRLADEIADYAWKQGLSDGAYSQADHDRKSCDASRAALEANLRTIGDPENTFPLNPNGSSKWAHLQKHDGAEAIGVVFRTGSGSVGSLVDGRVVWADWLAHPISGEPESVNAELLDALKRVSSTLETIGDLPSMKADVDAAIPRTESAIEGSPKPVTFPAMKAAFRTTRVEAGEFIMAFKFRDIEDMDRADDEWRAAMAIETPAKVSPCAGHAVQQEADEAGGA